MNTLAAVTYVVKIPVEFIVWWYTQAPITLLKILRWIFLAFVHLFSLKNLFTTFFKPWKNEYREGLVRTAIFIGAFIKTFIIIFDVFILSAIFIVEVIIFISWLAIPALAIFSLYGALFS